MIVKRQRLSGLYLIVFLYYVIYISYHLLFMPRTKNDYVRYMCQFAPDQYEELKKRSELGIPIAYHVRMAVKEYLAKKVN